MTIPTGGDHQTGVDTRVIKTVLDHQQRIIIDRDESSSQSMMVSRAARCEDKAGGNVARVFEVRFGATFGVHWA